MAYKYFAFISYSRADSEAAKWLHKRLERYRVPRDLRAGGPLTSGGSNHSLYPIFLDTEELASSSDLNESLMGALRASARLIVVCSPGAATSRWVEAEVNVFEELGRPIFAYVIEGAPNVEPGTGTAECFPPALRGGIEPLGADARENREVGFRQLLAGLLGVEFGRFQKREERRLRNRRLLVAAAILVLAVAGLVALRASNAEPMATRGEFVAKRSPAALTLELFDEEGATVDLELLYRLDGGTPQPMTLIADSPLIQLAATPEGTPLTRNWMYETDLGPELRRDVQLLARIRESRLGGSFRTVDLGDPVEVGNDPPQIAAGPSGGAAVAVPAEASAVVRVEFRLEDSSNDVTTVRVEYGVEGSDVWDTATSADDQDDRTYTTTTGAATHTFFWDSTADLAHMKRRVRVRLTPSDHDATGETVNSDVFVLDNNGDPVASIQQELMASSGDGRHGIPVPFDLSDADGHAAGVVVQWARAGETFPPLPEDPAELRALLGDRARRQALNVCDELPRFLTGRLAAPPPNVDPMRHLHLPELGSDPSRLGKAIDGTRAIELLRHAGQVASPEWDAREVGVLHSLAPLERSLHLGRASDGLTALAWAYTQERARLLEADLTSKRVHVVYEEREPSTRPSAMTVDASGKHAVVASVGKGVCIVTRIHLDTGEASPFAWKSAVRDGIRGLATRDGTVVLATQEDRVVRLDLERGAMSTVVTGLAQPHGIVLDPWGSDAVLVTEMGKNRVVRVDLRTAEVGPLRLDAPLRSPRALCLDGCSSLLVVTEPDSGQARLDSIRLGAGRDPADSSGAAHVVTPGVVAEPGSQVAVGTAGLRTLVGPRGDVRMLGGIECRVAVDPTIDWERRLVHTQESLARAPAPGTPWRVALGGRSSYPSRPSGWRSSFVWDTRGVSPGGRFMLRVTPFDFERGLSSSTGAGISVHRGIGGRSQVLVGSKGTFPRPYRDISLQIATEPPGPNSVIDVFDHDRDGVADYLRRDAEEFVFVVDGAIVRTGVASTGVVDARVADMDVDGSWDLVLLDGAEERLVVLRGTASGGFEPAPGSPYVLRASQSDEFGLHVGDLDRDGFVDVVCSLGAAGVQVFFNRPGGGLGDPVALDFAAAFVELGALAIGDVDRDGLDDVCVAAYGMGRSGGGQFVYYQTPRREFLRDPVGPVGEDMSEGATGCSLVHRTPDGALALVVVANEPNASPAERTYVQDIAGAFDSSESTILLAGAINPVGLAVIDMDGDGDLDLVTADRTSGAVVPVRNLGSGSFVAVPNERFGVPEVVPSSLTSGDIDGDGDSDLVLVDRTRGRVALVLQTDGVLQPASEPRFELEKPQMARLADIDGDGRSDLLVVAGPRYNRVHVFLQTSRLEFVESERLEFGLGAALVELQILDVDGDGRADVVGSTHAHSSAETGVFYQDGPGSDGRPSFEGPQRVSGGAVRGWADLDGDGDLDCAGGSYMALLLTEQTAPREFDVVFDTSLPAVDDPDASHVAFADLDHDGLLDVAVRVGNFQALTGYFVLEQTAPWRFAPARHTEVDHAHLFRGGGAARLVDIDEDGSLDYATHTDESVLILWGDH